MDWDTFDRILVEEGITDSEIRGVIAEKLFKHFREHQISAEGFRIIVRIKKKELEFLGSYKRLARELKPEIEELFNKKGGG